MNRWWIVLRKELSEVLRDRRALFNVVIAPLFFTPLLLALTGSMARREAMGGRTQTVAVAVSGWDGAKGLAQWFEGTIKEDRIRWVPVPTGGVAEAVRSRKAAAGLEFAEDTAERWRDESTVPVRIVFDPTNDRSRRTSDRLHELVAKRGARVVAQRLMNAGLSQQLAKPFDAGDAPLPGSGGAGASMLATLLPYLLALSSIMGGVFVANDTVAGEKERGTLESLLVTPIPRREVALGKFAATAVLAALSGALSLVGVLWPFLVPLPMFRWMTEGGLRMSPTAVAAMGLVLLPMSVFGAGVLLAVSTISRNQKEAQTYLTPVLLVASVLAMLSLVMGPDAPLATAMAPVLGPSLALKQALQGQVRIDYALLAGGMSVVYAAAALHVATRLFTRESVLLKA
ncbi:MAG: ABC transporter permease subunit [Armatimonadota bacterium]